MAQTDRHGNLTGERRFALYHGKGKKEVKHSYRGGLCDRPQGTGLQRQNDPLTDIPSCEEIAGTKGKPDKRFRKPSWADARKSAEYYQDIADYWKYEI